MKIWIGQIALHFTEYWQPIFGMQKFIVQVQ